MRDFILKKKIKVVTTAFNAGFGVRTIYSRTDFRNDDTMLF